MNEEMLEKYPYLKDRRNAHLIKIKIAPINKPSNHEDGSIELSKEAALQIITENKLSHMPIHYSKSDSNLPTKHSNNEIYTEIGHILNEGEIVSEDGIEYLEADVILHSESQKKYVDEIVSNKEILGNSWELIPATGSENNGITKIKTVDDFVGNAILDKNHTAFKGTKIVYASKHTTLNDYKANDELSKLKYKSSDDITKDDKKLLEKVTKVYKAYKEKSIKEDIDLLKKTISVFFEGKNNVSNVDYGKIEESFDIYRQEKDKDYYKKLSEQLETDNEYYKERLKLLDTRVDCIY